MNVLIIILLLTIGLSGCLRTPIECSSDSDCYDGEVCLDGKCLVTSTPNNGPIPGLNGRSSGSALSLDSDGYPQIITFFDDGQWWFSEWNGLTWHNVQVLDESPVGAINQTQLVRDSSGRLHFTFNDREEQLHIVSQTENGGWKDEVVLTTDGGAPFGASLTAGVSGQLAMCYVRGNFIEIRDGEAAGTAHVAIKNDDKWHHLPLPGVDDASPTFGCALSADSSGVAILAQTFIRTDGTYFSKAARSFIDPIDAIDFRYQPPEIDGRIPSANSVSYNANIASTITFARSRDLEGEVLNLMIGDEWKTLEVLNPEGENTIAEVGVFPDFVNPERHFFTISTFRPYEYTIGWTSERYLSKTQIELPTDVKTAVAVPDRDGIFHIAYPLTDGGVFYFRQSAPAGIPR